MQPSQTKTPNGLPAKRKKRLSRNKVKLLTVAFILLFFVAFFYPSMFIVIPSGHVGILFRPFWGGTVTDRVYREGMQIIGPWNRMYAYDVRIQTLRQEVDILSKNGLTVKVTVSVRYHIIPQEAASLHQRVGPEYRNKIIIPSTISSVREVIGIYRPEELYTTARKKIEDDILVEEIEQSGRIPIVYDDIIVENIRLPEMINQAIEGKIKQQQEYLAYEFRLAREKEEAKRKEIEAQGIKAYQDIVSNGLNPDLLRWLGIQATLELSKSPNAKIVVIGNSKEGLPLILNAPEGSQPTPNGKAPGQGAQKSGEGTPPAGGAQE
jgi:regulator of protease activity HflC (stomatin/prohibitin superfamily)